MTTLTEDALDNDLINPTPLEISTSIPLLSPKPGVSHNTKFLLLSLVPNLYILSGIGTALIYLVQELVSGLVINDSCSLYSIWMGINVLRPLK